MLQQQAGEAEAWLQGAEVRLQEVEDVEAEARSQEAEVRGQEPTEVDARRRGLEPLPLEALPALA
jgi:hypothetical protein